MSRHFDRSPGQFSPEFGNFRSPTASSPSKMNNYGGWRNQNSRRFRYHNELNFSPGGGGRRGGGHFRRGGGGFPRSSGSPDISAYVNRSMLADPWQHLPNPIDAPKPATPTKPDAEPASESPKTSQDDSQVTEESLVSCGSDRTVDDCANDSVSEQNRT